MMSNTSRSSGFTIAIEWRGTTRSADSCVSFFAAADRWSGLYIGLVVAYGALGYFKEYVPIDTVKRALTGMVAASGVASLLLRRFYLEGARTCHARIARPQRWHERGTASGFFLPSWLLHGLKWAIAFAVPLGVFCIGSARPRPGG